MRLACGAAEAVALDGALRIEDKEFCRSSCSTALRVSCKKLSQNGASSEKLCPFYQRYLKLWFSESTTWQIGCRRLGQSFPILQHRTTTEQSFSAIEQPRAKRPWCMQQGYRQMKSRRAAMQGENTRRLATYLGLARREFTQGG